MSRASGILGTWLPMLLALAPTAGAQVAEAPAGRELMLADAERIALNNSPVLRRAEARVEQARGRVTQAGLYPNPRYDGGNPHQLGGTQSLYNTGVTQPVVTGGKIPLDVAIAQRALAQAQMGMMQQRFALLTEVRRQFFRLLTFQEQLDTAENLQQIARQSLEISQQLLQRQQGPETDVLLLRVQASRIEVNLANLETTVEAGRRSLASIIGVPDLPIARVRGDLAMPLPDFREQEAEERLMAVNSQLAAARTEIARNRIRLQRARVAWIPDVECQAGYQYTVMPSRNQAVIGTYFDVPLWNRNQGNIIAASANVRESQAHSVAVANELLRQLSGSLGRYDAARRKVAALERRVLPDARRSFALVQQGYQEGEFELVRLLNAQRTLFETNLDYISAQQDRLLSGAEVAGLLQLEQFP